jgi:hypothetical protein
MSEKKFGKSWLYWGKISGFSIGFQISRHNFDLSIGFWYVGWEF